MKLPILVSVPHAGTAMPDEVASLSRIARDDVVKDGDEQAREIFFPLRDDVAHVVTTEVARAFVDVNRAPDDFRKDGVIKTHTCWDIPVYDKPLGDDVIAALLKRYYDTYHAELRRLALAGDVRVGIDCHTMVAVGPTVSPDVGQRRPAVCVSDADGSCDRRWTKQLAEALAEALAPDVRINDPFRGGYIIRQHATELPWLQLEISRGDFVAVDEKAVGVRVALEHWAERVFGGDEEQESKF